MQVTIESVEGAQVGQGWLAGFCRHQHSESHYEWLAGQLVLFQQPFTDDWTGEEKRQKAKHIQSSLAAGGYLAAAFADGVLAGFALLDGSICRGGMALDKIHVTEPLRRRGIGKLLFAAVCQQARGRGARFLFMATNPDRGTQLYYRALGCTDGRALADGFPQVDALDLPLIYPL